MADKSSQKERSRALPERFIVKRLLPHLVADPEGRTMFEREAELHAAMSHKNIVTVFGSGVTENGEPYLAMEYVDGCDGFRLLRRTAHERAILPLALSAHIAGEVLAALGAVHGARDRSGAPLDIIHRDVTPSNLYLSRMGEVKLGDFGIARSVHRAPLSPPSGESSTQEASLFGKFSYLSPEQVAGEPVDRRADLFSMATVLTEMVIGKPLFPGTGQLQVLLAIRDCRLGPLEEARSRLPDALFLLLQKGLARDPRKRFPDAASFSHALAPFATNAESARRELAARVAAVQAVSSETQMAAVRESARALRAVRIDSSQKPLAPLHPAPDPRAESLEADGDADGDVHHQTTGHYPILESFVHRSNGDRLGPWPFSRLVEAIATGAVRHGDKVDYLGTGIRPIEEIHDLARLLPNVRPGEKGDDAQASYVANLADTTMLDVLAYVLGTEQSGRMVVVGRGVHPEDSPFHEVFFLRGRLHHIVSRNTGELLGESLVRRGKLAREELDLALAVLPRYGGRMGDTLVALGLVDGVDVARAICDQGRDRMVELFLWREGTAEFFPDAAVPAVAFALDLDLPTLMLDGVEACHPGDGPMGAIEPRLHSVLVSHRRPELEGVRWPPLVAAVREAIKHPMPLRDVLAQVTKVGLASGADVARALEVLLAMDLARWE